MRNHIWCLLHHIWCLLLFVSGCCFGCSQSGETEALKASLRTSEETIVAASSATVTKTDEAIIILKENTTALAAIKANIEALQVVSNPNGEEVIKSAPESPAKANTALASVKVATPGTSSLVASDGTRLRWSIEGDWNPDILETSAHLREHGINTDGMTHQEMADIHASIHEGKQTPVSAVRVKNASSVSHCPGGNCPTNRTQRRRGLLGGLFR
jgi:hypothetical protein